MLNDADKQKCIEAAEFVLTEMERFHKLVETGASFSQTFGNDAVSMIEFMSKVKHIETGREYTCGRQVMASFRTIASILLLARPDSKDFDAVDVTNQLRDTFLSYVFSNVDKQLSEFIEAWTSASIRKVYLQHRNYTHYIACMALQIGNEDSYSFGPITFFRKSLFRDKALASLAKYDIARNRLSEIARRKAIPGLQWCWERKSESTPITPEETFTKLTKGVEWIAKIPVPRCANKISEIRAEKALRTALSSFTVLLQGSEGASLRLVNDPFFPSNTMKLSSIGDGNFRPSSSWQFGAPKVEEGWQEYIADQANLILKVMHYVIQQILQGTVLSFGFQIALRAITWYADAIRDTNVETRLFKCATAIECLLFPVDRKATATFVIRGSLLAQRQGQPMSHWAPIARRLYERRSDVARGNLESLYAAREESCRSELDFTRNVILQFLMLCERLQPLGPRRAGTKADFIELYRELEGDFHDEIAKIVSANSFNTWKIVPKQSGATRMP